MYELAQKEARPYFAAHKNIIGLIVLKSSATGAELPGAGRTALRSH